MLVTILRSASVVFFALMAAGAQAQQSWTFAVSGDSRNCGDVVMPAIAAGVHQDQAAFYWHLGDFRAIYDFDQDYKQLSAASTTIIDYEKNAWDFITLDSSSPDQFDTEQMAWFERVLAADTKDNGIATLVVGMHEALPDSIASDHSMNASSQSEASGRRAYSDLLKLQQTSKKNVYVLASHSHFFMDGIFNTEYWRNHGGVLPGWIVGTAGAVRYALPPHASDAKAAKTNVYGYLLATVHPDRTIDFHFHELQEKDIPAAVVARFSQDFVHQCFIGNRSN